MKPLPSADLVSGVVAAGIGMVETHNGDVWPPLVAFLFLLDLLLAGAPSLSEGVGF